MSVGTMLINHQHDKHPIALMWHQLTGVCLIAVAVSQLATQLAHTVAAAVVAATPRSEQALARVLELVHTLAATVWMVTGLTVVLMGFGLYAPKLFLEEQSLHVAMHALYHTEEEAMTLYFAIALWMSAILVSMMRITAPRGSPLRGLIDPEQQRFHVEPAENELANGSQEMDGLLVTATCTSTRLACTGAGSPGLDHTSKA